MHVMAYQEPKKRTIRLDDDVWEALKAHPMSANKLLRAYLGLDGRAKVMESAVELVSDQLAREARVRQVSAKPPKAEVRAHMVHSGTRPIAGCEICGRMAK